MYQYRKINIEELKTQVKIRSEAKSQVPTIDVLHLEWILDGLANQLQKEASEISEQYKESGGTPFNDEAKGLMKALEAINEFFCTYYETDGQILMGYFNKPITKN